MTYNTKQKENILNVIKSLNHEFTVKELYDKLTGIGLTTVYRLVDKLVGEGTVKKTIGKDNNTYYQYLGVCNHKNHFYLKCDICSKLEHVDCDCIINLWDHINKEHEFNPSNDQIIINGICKDCNKESQLC